MPELKGKQADKFARNMLKMENKDKFKEEIDEIMYYQKDFIDLIKVNWVDARSILDTISLKEAREEKLIDVISFGYLIDENDESIKICSFIFPDMQHDIEDPAGQTGFRNIQIIPKKMIKSILSLKIDFKESEKWRKNVI